MLRISEARVGRRPGLMREAGSGGLGKLRLPMHCKRCMRPLDGWTGRHCPDCGKRRHDPISLGWLGWTAVVLAAYPFLIYGTFFAAWCCGRHAFGRWPVAGRDEHPSVEHAGFALCKELVWLEMTLWVPVLVATGAAIAGQCVWAVVRKGRWRTFRYVLMVTVGVGAAGMGLMSFDPFECAAWYVD